MVHWTALVCPLQPGSMHTFIAESCRGVLQGIKYFGHKHVLVCTAGLAAAA